MSLAKKLNKIELKAEVLAKEKENELNYKTFLESNQGIPKIPIESFTNPKSLFTHELNYLHPLKNYMLKFESESKIIFSSKNHFLQILDCFVEINSIYHLTMKNHYNESNLYTFTVKNKTSTIEFAKDITHIKDQDKIDMFMYNIVPKIHRRLADLDYQVQARTLINMSEKKRFLSIEIHLTTNHQLNK